MVGSFQCNDNDLEEKYGFILVAFNALHLTLLQLEAIMNCIV